MVAVSGAEKVARSNVRMTSKRSLSICLLVCVLPLRPINISAYTLYMKVYAIVDVGHLG